jgi:DNA mismatch repair ATPase MutS
LLYLETHRYSGTPRLARLCAPFWRAARRPSAALKQIIRIAGAAGVQQSNLLGFLVNALVPWDLYFAHRLNQYKTTIKADLPVWIDTWYDLEALSALANFGALHPDYVFPDVLPVTTSSAQPVLRACSLGHPLLPPEDCVCNDFTFAHLGEIALITGSNMSGKSTFLRTLGVNLCLAYAGAPVNATALQTRLLRLFTCIKVSDSVTDGISYFYAEVRRLKALLHACEAEEPIPLCFLIDEIFRGTNNRERLIGSRAYIYALARGHGVGIISTHDLELVTLADTVPGIRNYHFREEVHDGRMIFDYQLRPGPCPTTNALQIMQMEGLPIAEAPTFEKMPDLL